MNHDEEVEVGDDSDESEPSQPSYTYPSGVLRAAPRDPVQTSSLFSAKASNYEAEFSTHLSSSIRSRRELFAICMFFHLFVFYWIAYLHLAEKTCTNK